ncbi:MAG TPA: P-loop NTPase [Halobacteriales archaeon]|nr:P-loop NTPase [Halobacteriales archaeon]
MARSHTISVAGAKGGVGKTTTSLNLAAVLSEVGPTVVVEFDLAMANSADFLSIDCTPDVDPTLHDVLADTETVKSATYPAPGGFDIVPSGTTLDGYAETKPHRIAPVVKALSTDYQYVLIDVGAGLSRETLLPMAVADETIVVSTPRVASVRDAKKTIGLVDRVGGSVAGVIFVKSGTGSAPNPDRIASFLEVDLLGHVPEDGAVPASQDAGKPVITHAPDSAAARGYRDAVETILQRRNRGMFEGVGEGESHAGRGRT